LFRQKSKHKAYLFICACCAPLIFYGQKSVLHDTLKLQDVQVTASRLAFSHVGKKTENVDSSVLSQYRYNSIADVLSYNSAVHIKTYGPGGLSSTALRGGSAEQTAILWNGFNLQNTMLGQSDLALMPSLLFDEMSVEYGGSSALWGSGAVGGSIRLNNRETFGQGLKFVAGTGAGSYGLRNFHAKGLYSGQRFVSSTKLFSSQAVNDYEFLGKGNQSGEIVRQQKAGYNFKNLLQEFRFLINKKQILTLNTWLSENKRQIPSFAQAADSKITQQDNAIRINASWKYSATRFRSEIRGAFFNDRISYTDSVFPIFSKSNTKTLMLENENYFQWLPGHQLNIGLSALTSSAQSTNYQSIKGVSRLSFVAGNNSRFFHERVNVAAVFRAEYFSAGALPVTGTLAFDWKFMDHFSLGANFAKVYRQPTLNELYWTPGGNPHLRPEQGYTGETVLKYTSKERPLRFSGTAAAYSRKINDWILWVPGFGGNPSPMNIQKVWSWGVESTWKLSYTKNKCGADLRLLSSYVLSTVISNGQENNNSVNKQLIYTPHYSLNGSLTLRYARTSIAFFNQYVGYRYTSTDNEEWLPPYYVTSLKVNHQVHLKKTDLSFFANCNNLFNADYQVVENRPMPLRYYELGISMYLHYKSSTNQTTNNQ